MFGLSLMRLIMLMMTVMIIWASMAEIDQSTRVTGQVIPSSRAQIIQSVDGGVLELLKVKEGDKVEKGQLIAVLDQTRAQASFEEVMAKATSLRADIIRLRAEILDEKPRFDESFKQYPDLIKAQMTLYEKRRQAFLGDIGSLEMTKKIAQDELNLNMPLLRTGDVSQTEVLKLRRQIADIQFQITTRQGKYYQDAQAELAKAEGEYNAITQNATQKKDALNHTNLYAPVNGLIKNVKFTTIGASLRPGDVLMEIVPLGDDLLIEVKVKPKDIAQIKPGLDANIKIDAYDYTVYGSMAGKLVYISPDTLEDDVKKRKEDEPYYRAQIKATEKKFNNAKSDDIEIQPGMTATVEIITGRNTVLKYLFKPVIKTLDESMNEK